MNQTNPHFTQFKNLTKEQQDAHDFEGYKYQLQIHIGFQDANIFQPQDNTVYRLVIEREKWYFCEVVGADESDIETGIIKGNTIIENVMYYDFLRPAKPSEIPKPAPTLEDRVKAEYDNFDVVMLAWDKVYVMTSGIGKTFSHLQAQSIRGFYKYVYEHDCAMFQNILPYTTDIQPLSFFQGNTILPVAVLFTRVKS